MFIELFNNTVSQYPEQVGVTWKEENYTWKEIDEQVCAVAGGLQEFGIGKGDCVALILKNTPTFVISFLASIRMGAPVVLINKAVQSVELLQIVNESDIKLIICEPANVQTCRDVLNQTGKQALVAVDADKIPGADITFDDLISSDVVSEMQVCHAVDHLVFQYSSGSTGRSKKLARSHAMCVADVKNHCETLEISARDSIFCTSPLFHTYAMGNCFFASVGTGARLVLFSDAAPFSLYRKQCLELLEKEKPTVLVTVPYICDQLTAVSEDYDLSSVRIATTAGSALSNEIFQRFLSKYNIALRQLYGCTEAGTLTVNLDAQVESSLASVGTPIKGVSIKIVDEENHQPVPVGTVGEVAVKTETMTDGYLGLPELNRSVFKDGFFYTSDLGWLDDAGRLTLTGRKIKYIVVHGNKVDPVEVEDVLLKHPSVQEAVVVGVAQTSGRPGDEQVKAAIVCREACSEQELIDWCRERLANVKVPSIIQFVDEIPKNPMGKVLRKLLI